MSVQYLNLFYLQLNLGPPSPINLAAQVGAVKGMDPMAAQLSLLNDQVAEIAARETFNVEKLEINNPQSEPASESLPGAIRKTASFLG